MLNFDFGDWLPMKGQSPQEYANFIRAALINGQTHVIYAMSSKNWTKFKGMIEKSAKGQLIIESQRAPTSTLVLGGAKRVVLQKGGESTSAQITRLWAGHEYVREIERLRGLAHSTSRTMEMREGGGTTIPPHQFSRSSDAATLLTIGTERVVEQSRRGRRQKEMASIGVGVISEPSQRTDIPKFRSHHAGLRGKAEHLLVASIWQAHTLIRRQSKILEKRMRMGAIPWLPGENRKVVAFEWVKQALMDIFTKGTTDLPHTQDEMRMWKGYAADIRKKMEKGGWHGVPIPFGMFREDVRKTGRKWVYFRDFQGRMQKVRNVKEALDRVPSGWRQIQTMQDVPTGWLANLEGKMYWLEHMARTGPKKYLDFYLAAYHAFYGQGGKPQDWIRDATREYEGYGTEGLWTARDRERGFNPYRPDYYETVGGREYHTRYAKGKDQPIVSGFAPHDMWGRLTHSIPPNAVWDRENLQWLEPGTGKPIDPERSLVFFQGAIPMVNQNTGKLEWVQDWKRRKREQKWPKQYDPDFWSSQELADTWEMLGGIPGVTPSGWEKMYKGTTGLQKSMLKKEEQHLMYRGIRSLFESKMSMLRELKEKAESETVRKAVWAYEKMYREEWFQHIQENVVPWVERRAAAEELYARPMSIVVPSEGRPEAYEGFGEKGVETRVSIPGEFGFVKPKKSRRTRQEREMRRYELNVVEGFTTGMEDRVQTLMKLVSESQHNWELEALLAGVDYLDMMREESPELDELITRRRNLLAGL